MGRPTKLSARSRHNPVVLWDNKVALDLDLGESGVAEFEQLRKSNDAT